MKLGLKLPRPSLFQLIHFGDVAIFTFFKFLLGPRDPKRFGRVE